MTINFNWKQILIVACNILVGIYLVLAVTAFNNPDEAMAKQCTEVKIDIEKESMEGFLNPNEVKKLLTQYKLYPLSQPMNSISTRKMEETLKKSPFVDKAECYKTLSGHVCINIKQRIPVIRIMAVNGDNYYLDHHGNIMPEAGYATDILIATGNITKKYAQTVLSRIANHIVSEGTIVVAGDMPLIAEFGAGQATMPVMFENAPATPVYEGSYSELEGSQEYYKYGSWHFGGEYFTEVPARHGLLDAKQFIVENGTDIAAEVFHL